MVIHRRAQSGKTWEPPRVDTLPSCFSSHTANTSPRHSLLGTMVSSFLLVTLLFNMDGPIRSAEGLCSVHAQNDGDIPDEDTEGRSPGVSKAL